jgi:osmotically-inducible protein OsmY
MKQAWFAGRWLLMAIALGVPAAAAEGPLTHPTPVTRVPENRNGHQTPAEAGGQGTQKPDREITREIRRAVVKDTSLSTLAHNVTILVSHGAVTLWGAVRSRAERGKIGSVAKSVSGVTSVQNNLSFKTKQP